jgi:16S rRNA (cytosine967-C5)-methyltransferase
MGDRGETVAVEIDSARAAEVAEQAQRLGLRSVVVIEADAASTVAAAGADTGQAAIPSGFDRVLVDAPCSDLGALASRPDARWRKSPRQIERLLEVQAQILRRAASALRPGGVLVYSTCTVSRRENEDRITALLEEAGGEEVPPLVVDDLGALAPEVASEVDSRFLQVRPDRHRTTGFFICRLKRETV